MRLKLPFQSKVQDELEQGLQKHMSAYRRDDVKTWTPIGKYHDSHQLKKFTELPYLNFKQLSTANSQKQKSRYVCLTFNSHEIGLM